MSNITDEYVSKNYTIKSIDDESGKIFINPKFLLLLPESVLLVALICSIIWSTLKPLFSQGVSNGKVFIPISSGQM